MKHKGINKLLNQYLSDSISNNELLEMLNLINQMTDDELIDEIHKVWMDQNMASQLFYAKAAKLLPQIKEKLNIAILR